ncbi:MAG: DUF2339 domain-containing protein [Winogradskyella sp.]
MAANQEIINKMIEKLELLYKKQAQFNAEINTLREALYRLKTPIAEENREEEQPVLIETPKDEPQIEEIIVPETTVAAQPIEPLMEVPNKTQQYETYQKPIKPSKSSLEKFIGENLLNKIGIAITVIGVAIGAKYSIDNNLISPLTRIILGYIMAMGLLGFGLKLRQKYEAYSAVLVSGAIVTLYFITYFSYSLYELLPQIPTFILMVIFTLFAIVAALSYNRQVIAHIGLVGAYAVPFLLSNGSGQVAVLFSYMALINCGILVISFKKYWKPLFYSAFVMTWLIYSSWFFADYNTDTHFALALMFLIVFFLIFYSTVLAYKLIKKEIYVKSDIILLLLNSFLFFGFGYAILSGHAIGENLLGIFTVCNAIIHFGISAIIYKKQLADKNLFYLIAGLVLVFITIAIPIQLDGNWVTLLWIGEAALLFFIGRTKAVSVYEKLSYVLMFLAIFSIIQDHGVNYFAYKITFAPLLNIHFLSSVVFISAFGFICYIQNKTDYISAIKPKSIWLRSTKYAVPAVLFISIYVAFRLEIEAYFSKLYYQSVLEIPDGKYTRDIRDYDLTDFKSLWVLNYSLLFMGLLYYFNLKKVKSKLFGDIIFGSSIIAIFVFLIQGLYVLSELRDSYLEPSEYFNTGVFHIVIRYISFTFLAFTLYTCYQFVKQNALNTKLKLLFDVILHISILWGLSSELIQWMVIGNSEQSYKLGLSILWGLYSFVLIAFGIWKSKQYLRIGGMVLFGITLIKLFVYDIAHLNTISKTIVFVALGVLLLIISFLYNKFKIRIEDAPKN